MRSVKLHFNGEKTSISLTEDVRDANSLLQCVAVNTATREGSDFLFSERGTSLASKVHSGEIYSHVTAMHECNFAGLDVLRFESQDDANKEHEAISNVDINPIDIKDNRLSVSIGIYTNAGVFTTETTV